ncbi:MAG: mechanosensitive ion channel family protein [Leptolyngbyaceae cyanobacterium SM2_5_2]|nr:mechanosensitive ion channel family protein [Leptolyngbyaceae cyanobacterium SM2_5_2]
MDEPFDETITEPIADTVSRLQQWLSDPNFIKLLVVIIGSVIIAVFFQILRRFATRKSLDSDTRYRIRKSLNLVSYLATALFALLVFSDSLVRFTVFFGVIGAGVAFALQEVITSFAGWVAISFGQFYKPGDRVQLGGIMGDVIDISILRTTLMECGDWVKSDLYNGRIVRIANSFVFKEPVFNYSGDFPFLWDEIVIPVKYGSDHRWVRQMLMQAAQDICGEFIPIAQTHWSSMLRKYLLEDSRVEPMVTLVTTDNWLEFTVRYVVNYKQRRGKKDELFTRVLDEFLQHPERATFASTTVHLVELPSINVRVDSIPSNANNLP